MVTACRCGLNAGEDFQLFPSVVKGQTKTPLPSFSFLRSAHDTISN